MASGAVKLFTQMAKDNGMIAQPTIRQDLMKLHTLGELGRFNNLRLKAAKKAVRDVLLWRCTGNALGLDQRALPWGGRIPHSVVVVQPAYGRVV